MNCAPSARPSSAFIPSDKIRAYALQDGGADTVEANEWLGLEVDLRRYEQCAEILAELGLCRMRVMSNNPAKLRALTAHELEVVERSGLFEAVEGNILIYIHKELELQDVERRYPARHHVMVDDKLRILAAMKGIWGPRLTTVFPRQGHYALDPAVTTKYPPADVTVERLGDLLEYDLAELCQATPGGG